MARAWNRKVAGTRHRPDTAGYFGPIDEVPAATGRPRAVALRASVAAQRIEFAVETLRKRFGDFDGDLASISSPRMRVELHSVETVKSAKQTFGNRRRSIATS